MDKLTKFILLFASAALLTIIIGVYISNRPLQKNTASLSPPKISPVVTPVKKKEEKANIVIEKQKKRAKISNKQKKQPEGIFIPPEKRVSPSLYPSEAEFYPETEPPLPLGAGEEMPTPLPHLGKYPPASPAGEFPLPEQLPPPAPYLSSGP
jgi:hypothetical protein